jgi:A/G-specific adenine glycosylase
MRKEYFWKKIMNWYSENKREFSWRKTQNSYRIFIAEVLLQQTNAEKVEPAHIKIAKKYPSIKELAEAELKELKDIIRPLGLIYRAKNLIKCAQIIEENYNGEVPENKDQLKGLPGVGNYIADAILCYSFDQDTIPIDTNFLRLFSRFDNLKSSYSNKKDDKNLISKIEKYYKTVRNYRDHNFAVLDFSSQVCKSRNPNCQECCLKNKCFYFKP